MEPRRRPEKVKARGWPRRAMRVRPRAVVGPRPTRR
jgi:hypothetical protein